MRRRRPSSRSGKLDLANLSPDIPDPTEPVTITFASWVTETENMAMPPGPVPGAAPEHHRRVRGCAGRGDGRPPDHPDRRRQPARYRLPRPERGRRLRLPQRPGRSRPVRRSERGGRARRLRRRLPRRRALGGQDLRAAVSTASRPGSSTARTSSRRPASPPRRRPGRSSRRRPRR